MTPDLKCDVCQAPAVGVCSSSLGPCSFAYCAECLAVGAEPYRVTVCFVADLGAEPAAVADWFLPVIAGTCQRAGKPEAEFWADVRAAAERMRQEGGA